MANVIKKEDADVSKKQGFSFFSKGSKKDLSNNKKSDKPKKSSYSKFRELKDAICCKNVNAVPDDHIQIINANKIYSRVLYISEMPRRATFAYTFEPIFKFGHSHVSVFIKPQREGKAIKELSDTIVELDAERMMNEGKNINRERRLTRLLQEAQSLLDAIDSGENAMFEVSIMVTLFAKNYEELNKLTDMLRNKARENGVLLSSPYSEQEKAFVSNLPVNNNRVGYYHLMDKYSLSTLFHYTKGSFGHKTGAIIGRNMDTGALVSYNFFERSMNGFNLIISGMTRSGKSTLVKVLSLRSVRPDGIEIISLDPEGEYGRAAEALNGINIVISNSSTTIINPFELDIEYKKDEVTNIEYEYLDLKLKITDVTYNLLTMARGAEPETSPVNDIDLGIIKEIVTSEYERVGIKDGDCDSLFEVIDGVKKKKILPTVGSWYKKLLSDDIRRKYADNPTYSPHYDYLVMVMKDYAREAGGTKLYFDGQSTVSLKPGTSFINFDIHAINEKFERPIVQSILISWMWETRFKKNSEDPLKAKQIVALFDETHYLLPYKEARAALTTFYRRAAKKNVATLSASQNINDFLMYEDCHAIFTNATTKILLRHDLKEREALKKLMNVTDVEADLIVGANKGEAYIISGNDKAFVKVDLLDSEKEIIETDMNKRKELAKTRQRAGR